MRHFWSGFTEKRASIQFKAHQVVLFWSPGQEEAHGDIQKIASRYPSVRLRLVNSCKEPDMMKKHAVEEGPTVMLMKHGREIDRIRGIQQTIVEQMFQRAGT